MYVGWFPVGFFNPVIPTLMFAQFRNPEGYFEHPATHATLNLKSCPHFALKSRIPAFK